MSVFRFLRFRKTVPDGFVDYDVDALSHAFDVNVQTAKSLVRAYHRLLSGGDYFGTNIGRADLGALSKAVSSEFGTGPATSASIARWFGRLRGVREEQIRVQKLGVTEMTWRTACHYGSQDGNLEHASFDGRKFSPGRGLPVGESYLLPGAEIGCKCMGSSVVHGFDE